MTKSIKSIKVFVPIIILAALVLFLYKGLGEDPHKIPSALIGKQAPQFNYPNLNDPDKRITNSIFKDHLTLLHVFASWCSTCRAEHSVIMDIAKQQVVTLVGLVYKDKPSVARQWLKKYGNPYSSVISDKDGRLGIDLGVYGTPETFLIDKHGIIRYRHVGPISPDDWKDELMPRILRLKNVG